MKLFSFNNKESVRIPNSLLLISNKKFRLDTKKKKITPFYWKDYKPTKKKNTARIYQKKSICTKFFATYFSIFQKIRRPSPSFNSHY